MTLWQKIYTFQFFFIVAKIFCLIYTFASKFGAGLASRPGDEIYHLVREAA
jgi:hypothetical protein